MPMPYPSPPPSPTVPTKQPNRTLRTVLIIGALVVLLCCGGAIGGGILLFKTVDKATAPAREATAKFFDAVATGDTASAYDQLCAATKGRFTPEQFDELIKEQGPVHSYELAGASVSNMNGVVTGTVTIRLERGAATETWEVSLAKEAGQWKVCGPF